LSRIAAHVAFAASLHQTVVNPPLGKIPVQEFDPGPGRIDIEEEGYDIIPEVRACFEQLEIPAELLPLIQEISMDGGDEIYVQLYPFWDGEDEVWITCRLQRV